MRVTRLVLSFLLILSSSPRLNSQQPVGTSQRDPQALTVLAQVLAVLAPGGVAAVQDALIQGTYTTDDGTQGTITFKYKGSSLLRHELNLPGAQQALLLRNGEAYSISNGQKTKLPPWTHRYRRSELIAPFSRLADYSLTQTNVVYVGLETLSGRQVHHIRLSSLTTDDTPAQLQDLISEFHLFVDAQTGLMTKTITYDYSPTVMQNRTAVENYYDNYLPTNGLLVPNHITRYIYGQKFAEITLTSVQTNVGLSDSDFQ